MSRPGSSTTSLPSLQHATRDSKTVAAAIRHESWLAIHLPHYMLEALGAQAGAPRTTDAGRAPPLVVVDVVDGARVVCAHDAAAAAAGIVSGMAFNSALALAPGLRGCARDPRRERGWLDARAEWALRYTPRVSLEPPDALLLEVRGSLALFGGARRLCERIRDELRTAGIEAHVALTPTPLSALWFARSGQGVVLRRVDTLAGRLAPLPIGCTRWPGPLQHLLGTMGVRTLGECQRLPRDGLARRLDPGMLQMLDRALGRVPDPRVSFRARERFTGGCDPEPEIVELPSLVTAVEPLLAGMCDFAARRRGGVQWLDIRLMHRGAVDTRVRLGLTRPSADYAHVAMLVGERLARVALTAPVRGIRVRSGPLVPVPDAPGDLFAAARSAPAIDVPELVERLRARLGVAAVHGLCLVPEHRPEAAWRASTPGEQRCLPSVDTRAVTRTSMIWPESPRPLWLLPEPLPLASDDDRRPRYEGALELEEGPERIESGWWDGHDVVRDYYVARSSRGMRLWIFRTRAAARVGDTRDGWFLHGMFG